MVEDSTSSLRSSEPSILTAFILACLGSGAGFHGCGPPEFPALVGNPRRRKAQAINCGWCHWVGYRESCLSTFGNKACSRARASFSEQAHEWE